MLAPRSRAALGVLILAGTPFFGLLQLLPSADAFPVPSGYVNALADTTSVTATGINLVTGSAGCSWGTAPCSWDGSDTTYEEASDTGSDTQALNCGISNGEYIEYTLGTARIITRIDAKLSYPVPNGEPGICAGIGLLSGGVETLAASWQITCQNCIQDFTTTLASPISGVTKVRVHTGQTCCGGWTGLRLYDLEVLYAAPGAPDAQVKAAAQATFGGTRVWWTPHDGLQAVDGYSVFYSTTSHPILGASLNSTGYTYVGTYPCCTSTVTGLTNNQTYHWRVVPVNAQGEGGLPSEEFYSIPGTGAGGKASGRDVGYDLLREVWETYADGTQDARYHGGGTFKHVGHTLNGAFDPGGLNAAQVPRDLGDQNKNTFMMWDQTSEQGGITNCQSSTRYSEIRFARPVTFTTMRVAFGGAGGTAGSYCFQLSYVNGGVEMYIPSSITTEAASTTGAGSTLVATTRWANFTAVSTDTLRIHVLPIGGSGAPMLNDLSIYNANDTVYPYVHALADALAWNAERLATPSAGPGVGLASQNLNLASSSDYVAIAYVQQNAGGTSFPVKIESGGGVSQQRVGYSHAVDPDGGGLCRALVLKFRTQGATSSAVLKWNNSGFSDYRMCRLQPTHTYALPTPGPSAGTTGQYIRADMTPWGGTTNDIWGVLYHADQFPLYVSTDNDLMLNSNNDLDTFEPATILLDNPDYVSTSGVSVQWGKLAGNVRIVVLGQDNLALDQAAWKLKVNSYNTTRLYGGTCNAGTFKCAAFLVDDVARRNGEAEPSNATVGHGSTPFLGESYAFQLVGSSFDTSRPLYLMVPKATGSHYSYACAPNGLCAANARVVTTLLPAENVPPPVPTATCSDGNAQVVVSWGAVAGALSYKVWYSLNEHPNIESYIFWTQTSSTNSTITSLTNGNTYHVRVQSVGIGGESAGSPDVTCKTVAPPAGAPSVTAAPGDGQISLSWIAPNSADVLTPRTDGATTPCTNTQTTPIVTVSPGSRYVVVAGKSSGTAQPTDSFVLATPGRGVDHLTVRKDGTLSTANAGGLAALDPRIVRHVNVTSTSWYAEILFTWPTDAGNGMALFCDNSGTNTYREWTLPPGVGADFGMPGYVGKFIMNNQAAVGYLLTSAATGSVSTYDVYYDTASHPSPPAGYTFLRTVTGTTTTHTGLDNGVTYHYVVRANNAGGTGPFSTDVSATPVPGAPAGAPVLAGNNRGPNLLRAATLSAPGCSQCPSQAGAASDYNDGTVQTWQTPSVRSTANCDTDAHLTLTYTFPAATTVGHIRVLAQNVLGGGGFNACLRADGVRADGSSVAFGRLGTFGNGNPAPILEGTLSFTPVSLTSLTFALVCSQCSPPAVTGLNLHEVQAFDTQQTTKAGLWWNTVSGATSYSVFQSPRSASASTPMNASGDYFYVKTVPPPGSGSIVETTVTGLNSANDAFFRVVGSTAGGEGPASNQLKITTAIPPPSSAPVVSLVPGDGSIGVSWTSVAGATTYSVFSSTTSRGLSGSVNASGYAYIGTTLGASLAHSGLTNGQPYYYRVVAGNEGGEGPASVEVSAVPSISPPSTLTATALNPTGLPPGRGVSLTWTNPTSSGFIGVEIRRNTTGVPILLVQLPAANTSFVDAAAPEGVNVTYTTYSRTEQMVGTNGRSTTVLTVSPTPQGVSAQGASGVLNASWIASAGSLVYFVHRDDGQVFTVLAPQRWYRDEGLALGTKHTYNVSAANAPGQSLPSANVTGTVGLDARTIAPGLKAYGNFSRLIPDTVTARIERNDTGTTYYVIVARYYALQDRFSIVTTPYEWKGDGSANLTFTYPAAGSSTTEDEGGYWTFMSLKSGTILGGFSFQLLPDWASRFHPSYNVPTTTESQLARAHQESLAAQNADALENARTPSIGLPQIGGVTSSADMLPLVFGFAMVCVIAALAAAFVGRRLL